MLDLIEHLASGVKDVPLLILCLARADLLDERPSVGRGQRARHRRSSWSALPRGGQRRARRRARRGRVGRALARAAHGRARHDRGEPALHRGDGADAARVRRGARRDPAHRAGDDLRPDRPAAAGGAEGAAPRRRRGPDVLVGRDRGDRRRTPTRSRASCRSSSSATFSSASRARRSAARRRTGSSTCSSATSPMPASRSRRARSSTGRWPSGSRARRSRTSWSRSVPTISTRPPSWRRSSRAACRPTSPRRPPRRSSRRAAGRSRERRTRSRDACSCVPSSSSRRWSAGTWPRARRGG